MVKQKTPPGNKKYFGLYYGYVIVAACFLIMTLTFGAQSTFGVFFKPMSGEFDWTRAETSGPFALYMMVAGLLSIISGKLSDRLGPQVVVSAGAIFMGTGYILMSFTDSLWQLYVYFGLLVAIGTSTVYVPLVAMIAKAFTEKRGLMSGIGIAGIGFGIGIMSPIASWLIEIFKWRTALLIMGGGVVLLIILLAQLLRNLPLQRFAEKDNAGIKDQSHQEGLSFKQALRTSQLWMIFIAWVLYGFFFQVAIVHIVPYATDLGMVPLAAATLLTTIGIIGTVGRVGLGLIGDRFGIRKTVLFSFGIIGIAYVGLVINQTVGMLYIFAVIYGVLSGCGILLVPMLANYFGFKELGIISGIIVFANSTGAAIGPPVAGGIFDATGSYQWAFILCAASGIAAAVIVLLLKKQY